MKALLSFDWHERPRVSLAFPGFIGLSIFLHATAFYLFQIAYPSGATIAAPPADVTLLVPSTEEQRALLSWIEAENPALIARDFGHLPGSLLESTYQASYDEPKALPPLASKGRPDPLPALNLPTVFKAPKLSGKKRGHTKPSASQIIFSGSLNHAPLYLDSKQTGFPNLAPARFLIGVSSEGSARYVFKEESSGDALMDAEIEQLLVALEFPRSALPWSWGYACVMWGKEAYGTP